MPADQRYAPVHPVNRPGRGVGAARAACITVNSLHGQAIDRLAPGLAIEAIASDGTIEAAQRGSMPRASSSPCSRSPEWRVLENPVSLRLFAAFGAAARAAARVHMSEMERWPREREITEVECLVPDMSGIARGKILPAKSSSAPARARCACPRRSSSRPSRASTPDDEDVTSPANSDIYMRPDENTMRLVPWYTEATAQVISDCDYADGSPVDISPRWVLKRVLELYDARGWQPIVAPELEFFLVQVNKDPDYPLVPPVGRSGRPGERRVRATASTRSTSSTRSSRTSTTTARPRRSTSTR